MNEYIILHRATDLGTLLEVRTIHEFGTKNTLEGERNFVRFKDITKEDFLCNESPDEIEALIMGRNESNWRECMRGMDKEISDGYTDYKELENRYKILQEENAKLKEQLDIAAHEFKYSHFALPSITANEDPIDYLSDKVNRLIYELEKLEKENSKLKKELDAFMNDLTYPELNSHVGRCIFSPIKAKRVCAACASKLEIGDNSAQTNSTIQQATEQCLKAQEYNELLNNEIKVLDKEIAQLKEENANLKEQLETLKQRSEKWVADINGLQFKNASLTASLNASNPANPCCRETYLKLHEALCTVSRNDRLDLINWDQSFIDAIRENKNVKQPKGENNGKS